MDAKELELLDLFAAHVIQGLHASTPGEVDKAAYAKLAYEQASIMLAARKKFLADLPTAQRARVRDSGSHSAI